MLRPHCALQSCNAAHTQTATSKRAASKTRFDPIFCPWLIKYGGFSLSNSVIQTQFINHRFYIFLTLMIYISFPGLSVIISIPFFLFLFWYFRFSTPSRNTCLTCLSVIPFSSNFCIMDSVQGLRFEGSWGHRHTFLGFGAQNLQIYLLKGHLCLFFPLSDMYSVHVSMKCLPRGLWYMPMHDEEKRQWVCYLACMYSSGLTLGPGARGWKWIGCPPPIRGRGVNWIWKVEERGTGGDIFSLSTFVGRWWIQVIVLAPSYRLLTSIIAPTPATFKYLCPLRSESKK